MQVKIDTKERFDVITLEEPILSDNIAAELTHLLNSYLEKDIKNVVLKLTQASTIEDDAAEQLARLQQTFYDNSASFVMCEVKARIKERLDALELLETMNITNTESEAWDIVQMEEIEREFFGDDDVDIKHS
ncbi:MAG TPA: STAS domain-containing protein [Segetibacter sp.]|jgi:anti-anti-sigma regulatory factor